jgi:UDP-N-acetylmuramate--alanine ligase
VYVHFIGIGGAGMSAIAKVLLEMGHKVSGSDLKESRYTLSLRKIGAEIRIGHNRANVSHQDLVVVSSAIPRQNVEVLAAKEKKIPVITRAKMLAKLGLGKRTIAISGTHGKTTTTSMIAFIMEQAKFQPTYLIGGELNDVGSNARYGEGDFLVTEADESDGSFLTLSPEIVVVTNIEPDHLDFYTSFTHILQSFKKFIDNIPEDGFSVLCSDDSGISHIIKNLNRRVVSYGLKRGAEFSARDIVIQNSSSSFIVTKGRRKLVKISLKVPGLHNISNALAAFTLCYTLGIPAETCAKALANFSGVRRRFEKVGMCGGVTVIDDYAHHPSEVKATLGAARYGDWSRIICVFQPHRYSRTKYLGYQFGDAFDWADLVILTDVYAAGEEPVPGITGKVLLEAILHRNSRKPVVYLPYMPKIKDFLRRIVKPGDLIITMGAGDIWTVGYEFIEMARKLEF